MLNVTYIAASLNAPDDFSIYVQNFTEKFVNTTVYARSQQSLGYEFMPPPQLEATSFRLAVTVFYETLPDKEQFSATFYNNTLIITEPQSSWNMRTLFMYVGGFAIVALVLALVHRSLNRSKSSSSVSSEGGNEWIPDYLASGGSGKKKAKKA